MNPAPQDLRGLENLGGLKSRLEGRYSEAEPLHVRSLAIFEQGLGVHHPNTVTVRRNLEQLREEMNGDEMME